MESEPSSNVQGCVERMKEACRENIRGNTSSFACKCFQDIHACLSKLWDADEDTFLYRVDTVK